MNRISCCGVAETTKNTSAAFERLMEHMQTTTRNGAAAASQTQVTRLAKSSSPRFALI
jgi:hypothetical protein